MINNEFPLIKLPHKLRNVIKFMVSKTPMFGTALWLVNEGRGTLELLKKKKKKTPPRPLSFERIKRIKRTKKYHNRD